MGRSCVDRDSSPCADRWLPGGTHTEQCVVWGLNSSEGWQLAGCMRGRSWPCPPVTAIRLIDRTAMARARCKRNERAWWQWLCWPVLLVLLSHENASNSFPLLLPLNPSLVEPGCVRDGIRAVCFVSVDWRSSGLPSPNTGQFPDHCLQSVPSQCTSSRAPLSCCPATQ
jgi:hypothetical protein